MSDTDYEISKVLTTYRKDGSLIREKARVLVEDWLDRIFPRLQDPDTPTSTLLSIGEALIRLGDLAPKAGGGAAATGPGFSITINIPQGDGKDAITITGRPEQGEDAPMLDITDFNPLPPKPAWIPVPDFNLNAALAGGMVGGAVPPGTLMDRLTPGQVGTIQSIMAPPAGAHK